MKFREFRSNQEIVEGILPSWNPGYGFIGTLNAKGAEAKKLWDEAFKLLTAKAHQAGLKFEDQDVRNFLDSSAGRHLADQVNDNKNEKQAYKSVEKAFNSFTNASSFKKRFGDTIKQRDMFEDHTK